MNSEIKSAKINDSENQSQLTSCLTKSRFTSLIVKRKKETNKQPLEFQQQFHGGGLLVLHHVGRWITLAEIYRELVELRQGDRGSIPENLQNDISNRARQSK